MPINSIEGLDTSTYPGQPLETPAHLNFLKQFVPCLNSPLHKLYIVVKWSSQRITVCRLWIRKKSLNKGWFSGLHRMLIQQLNYKNKLKYNTRSRSDTSDTSYLQKCSPNVMCYFWSPCKKAICLESHLFLPLRLLHPTHISSSRTHPATHTCDGQIPGGCWSFPNLSANIVSINVSFHGQISNSF